MFEYSLVVKYMLFIFAVYLYDSLKVRIMKKIMMMAALMFATVAASAQVYVGGGIGFGTSKEAHAEGTDVDSRNTFYITPEIGYNLSDDFAVGIGLGYNYSKKGDRKTNGFSIEPYARWTFAKWERVSLFLDGGIGYGFDKDKTTTDLGNGKTVSVEQKTSQFYIGIRPGLKVNLTNQFALITKVGWFGWTCTMPDGDNMKNGSDFGLNLNGENLSFGLQYTF